MPWDQVSDQAPCQSGQIVEDWLRSLGLIQYFQSFIDNGYDDLEVCKQIGDPDLDAIGVTAPCHREGILSSVATLREQGATHVYFTLEEASLQTPPAALGATGAARGPSVVAFPKLQLMSIVGDKLAEDELDLGQAPFANRPQEDNTAAVAGTVPFLAELAERYAGDLKTYPEDVLEAMLLIQEKSQHVAPPQVRAAGGGGVEELMSQDLNNAISMSPSSSPRHGSIEHISMESPRRMQRHETADHGSDDNFEKDEMKKKTSTIGRILRTVNPRRSGRKYTYKKHDGDLNASEITMSDEDRMQLMIFVKEGKITMQQAVDAVKQFEAERINVSAEREDGRGISTDSITSEEISRTPETSSLSEDSPNLSRDGDFQAAGPHVSRKLEKKRVGRGLSTPSGSPNKLPASKSVEASPQKDKKRGIFSSPFARRKGSDGKKDSHLVERSPQTPRRGIAGLLRGNREGSIPRHALPPLPPSRSGGAIVSSSSFQYSDRCRSSSPLTICRRSSESHIPLPPRSPGNKRQPSPVPVFRHPYDYENLRYMSRSDTDLGCVHSAGRSGKVHAAIGTQACGSDSGLYCADGAMSPTDSHVFVCEAQIHLCDRSSQLDSQPPSTRSSKRHTPPSSTPPDSHSPKRLHVISVPSSNADHSNDCRVEGTLPDRDKQFGSNSTMSMGSETSPPATIDSHVNKSHSRISQIPRRRASSFSTGDEAMSSDGEINSQKSKKGQKKGKEDSRKISPKNTVKSSKDSSMESIHTPSHAASTSSSRSSMSIEEDGTTHICRARAIKDAVVENRDCLLLKKGDVLEIIAQERKGWATGIYNGKRGLVKLADVEFIQELTFRRRPVKARNNSRRPKPKTVEELLERLQLQGYINAFMQNGFNTLELFSQLEEEDLNDLKIRDIQTRTKLLTAAQMLLDNVENSLDDSSSLSGVSNQSSSQSPIPLAPSDLTFAGQRDSVSSFEGGTLTNDSTQTLEFSPISQPTCDMKPVADFPTRRPLSSDASKPPEAVRNNGEQRKGCSTLKTSLNAKRDLFRKRSSSLESYPKTDRSNTVTVKPSSAQVTASSTTKSLSPAKKSQVPTYVGMIPRRVGSASPKPANRKAPLVPERTVSVTDDSMSNSCPNTPVKQRDACTQHGKSRALVRRSPSPSPSDHLVCSSPVPTASKIKTAHVRQITSSNPTLPHHQRSKLPKSQTTTRSHVSRHESLVGRPKSMRVSLSMEKIVAAKLEEELIDITQSPYSDKLGFCGVPASLVERYSEELHMEIWEAAQCIEHCRLKALQQAGRQGVQSDQLGQSGSLSTDTTSLPDFLISIGLPMYLEKLISCDITTLPQLFQTSATTLQDTGIGNEAHLHRFLVAIEATRGRFTSKAPQGSASHVITVSRKLFDKV